MATYTVHADDCEMSQIDASFNCTCGAEPEPEPECPACWLDISPDRCGDKLSCPKRGANDES